MVIIITYIFAQLLQPAPLFIVSPDFPDGGSIPGRFTCDGEDITPTLIVNGIPGNAQSLVLVVEDRDSGLGPISQWVVWNIPPRETITVSDLREAISEGEAVESGAYRGPCPTGNALQRYIFSVYALDTTLSVHDDAAGGDVLEKTMEGHVLAVGQILGEYSRAVVAGTKKNKK